MPRAAILLAQATGRLIRNATDRGVVAVLDPRLGTANYRWDIVEALPPMRRTRHRAEAEAFLHEITATRESTGKVADMGDQPVRCEVARGVATITLDSPSNRNALSSALVADLHAALDRAEQPDVRVIVLTHTRHRSSAPAPT